MAIVLPLPTFSARLEQNKALLSLDCILDPGHFTLTHRSLTEGRVGSLERLRAVRRGRGTSVTISPASMFEPHSNIWFLWCLEENLAGRTALKFGQSATRLRTGWDHVLPMEHSGQDRPRVRTSKVNVENFGFVRQDAVFKQDCRVSTVLVIESAVVCGAFIYQWLPVFVKASRRRISGAVQVYWRVIANGFGRKKCYFTSMSYRRARPFSHSGPTPDKVCEWVAIFR